MSDQNQTFQVNPNNEEFHGITIKMINLDGSVERDRLPSLDDMFQNGDPTCPLPNSFTTACGRTYVYLPDANQDGSEPIYEERSV